MKRTKIYRYGIFPIFILCLLFTACEEEVIPIIDPEKPVESEVIEDIINGICIEWESTSDYLVSYMKGYTQISILNETLLQFIHTKTSQSISYCLYEGKLSASVLLLPIASQDIKFQNILKEYVYLGSLNSGDVYVNVRKNTIATVWQPIEYDTTYIAIGFTPIESKAYEKAPDIFVTTSEDINLEMFKATVHGSVHGISEAVEVGFVYGTSNDLSEISKKSDASLSAGEFTMTIKGLVDEMTYYYCAYAIIEDVYYFGEVHSFTTGPITYTIDGRTFNMVKVEGGSMPAFSIMQTELPTHSKFSIGEYEIDEITNPQKRGFARYKLIDLLEQLKEITGITFRLPKLEEWQYAAQGGSKSKGYLYSGSNNIDEVAWYNGNCPSNSAQPIATKQPNELSIYDMSGNYAEVCAASERDIETTNIDGPTYGGNWSYGASKCTVTSWEKGSQGANTIPNSDYIELSAVDDVYITIRLVYTRE